MNSLLAETALRSRLPARPGGDGAVPPRAGRLSSTPSGLPLPSTELAVDARGSCARSRRSAAARLTRAVASWAAQDLGVAGLEHEALLSIAERLLVDRKP